MSIAQWDQKVTGVRREMRVLMEVEEQKEIKEIQDPLE